VGPPLSRGELFDLIVIGGGPAGMMAAGRAGELGARVLLLEKNARPGVKLLSTGKERCNLTNAMPARDLIKAFGVNGKFLFSALAKFDSSDTMEFFKARGVPIKLEDNNRAFPVSNKATDILDVMIDYLKESKVEIETSSVVKKLIKKENRITKVILADGSEFTADNFLIATGGLSYPTTGSTGDGYAWLKSLGHTITKTYPALTPIIVKDKIIKELEGVSLSGVKFTVLKNKVIDSRVGDAMITANGLSGPAIFALSSLVSRNLPGLKLNIDFLPNEKAEALDKRLQDIFAQNKNKQIKNVLATVLTARLVSVLLKTAKIKPELEINQLTKINRLAIIDQIKNFSLEISMVGGYDKAMLTTGGVALSEVDPKTMRSKIFSNLYLAGEILDLDGPTGGFNLQECWSTGRLAGESACLAMHNT